MQQKYRFAIGALASLMFILAASSLFIDRSTPMTVNAPHIEINDAWMRAVRGRDYATLNSLTCHPSDRNMATIKEQVDLIADILQASDVMYLHEAQKENLETRTVLVRTNFTLRREIRGVSEYTGAILVNVSSQNYCVIAFAMDRAFWPPQKKAQE